MKALWLIVLMATPGFGYIPNLEPFLRLNAQNNRGIQTFYAKSKIVLANDPAKEITEELWYTNKGILRSNLSYEDKVLSVKITRPDKSVVYGREVKTSEDLTPSFFPGVYIFSSHDFSLKIAQEMGIPLHLNVANPQAEYVNFGFGTLIRYAPNITDNNANSIFINALTKTIVGFRMTRNGRTLTFLATTMTSIEGKIVYPSVIEILNEENKSIGSIKLVTALTNIPSPDQITKAPGQQESNFWLHEWLR